MCGFWQFFTHGRREVMDSRDPSVSTLLLVSQLLSHITRTYCFFCKKPQCPFSQAFWVFCKPASLDFLSQAFSSGQSTRSFSSANSLITLSLLIPKKSKTPEPALGKEL